MVPHLGEKKFVDIFLKKSKTEKLKIKNFVRRKNSKGSENCFAYILKHYASFWTKNPIWSLLKSSASRYAFVVYCKL